MIGFYIGVPYWGNGYMTEAAHAMLGFGFGVLDLNRIEAGHFAGNHASGKVQRKIGLVYEGTRRSYFVVRGERTDDILHAIVREDFEPDLAKSIARAKAMISIGHDEYWSLEQFNHVKQAIADEARSGASAARPPARSAPAPPAANIERALMRLLFLSARANLRGAFSHPRSRRDRSFPRRKGA